MNAPPNRAEQFTHHLCTSTFLSPWCFDNPTGKNGKELCDVLVVCDPDVVVFSVKEVKLLDGDDPVHIERWQREAVESSVKQLYGASRWLASATHVIKKDKSVGIPLPPSDRRKIHRIAVAIGSRGYCSIHSGDLGKGHVNVFTEQTLVDIVRELDTITDFTAYLYAKEDFLTGGKSIMMLGTEADLLAMYLNDDRRFPNEGDLVVIEEDVWAAFCSKPEFQAKKRENIESYKWDHLIEVIGGKEGHDGSEFGLNETDREFVVRRMAREDRFCRRVLAKGFVEFLRDATTGKTRSRLMKSPSEQLYVFAYFKLGEDRTTRIRELYGRCLVAKNKLPSASNAVIGVALNEFDPKAGTTATDVIYLEVNSESEKWKADAIEIEETFGYFSGRNVERRHEEEYPRSKTSIRTARQKRQRKS